MADDLKHDALKPRYELIDPMAEMGLAMVLTGGAVEYCDQGWRRLDTPDGRDRVVGALMRHLSVYRSHHRTPDIAMDDQFSMPHSSHLLACAMFLAAFDMGHIHRVGRMAKLKQEWQGRIAAMKETKQLGHKA